MADPMLGISSDPVKFKEAIDALRRKVPMTDDEFAALEADELEFAFTVADVAQVDLVADVLESLQSAVENGTTLEDFKAAVGHRLESAWGAENPAAVETIFRTNVMTAYNAGRHEAATAVQDERPYWQYHAILDGRTSDICREMDGVCLPADHAWWRGHYPPMHHNSLAEGTLIVTRDGERPIESIRPGQLVLTHRRRWMPVAAVMGTRTDRPIVRRLHLSSGRTLCVSDDHPILTADVSGWKVGRDLKVGDKLFHHGKPVSGPCEMAIGNPDDCPPLVNQGLVPYEIALLADRAVMSMAIDLDSDLERHEGEIKDVRQHGELGTVWNPSGGDDSIGNRFTVSRMLSHEVGPGDRDPSRNGRNTGRIESGHSVGVGGHDGAGLLAETPCPMGAPAFRLPSLHHHRGLDVARTDLDSMSLAPRSNDGLADAYAPFDAADRFAAVPVSFLDKFTDNIPVSEIDWFHATIICIEVVGPQKRLWNLSVWADETYVASGVIVHNCRCIAVSLTETQAKREGITASPPRVEVPAGFGKPPSVSKWEPDPGKYPPALGAELEDKLAADG